MKPQEGPHAKVAPEHSHTIAKIRSHVDHQLSPAQRAVEAFTALIGRPVTILVVILGIAAWIAWNRLEEHSGRKPIDPAPFFWLQGATSLYAALVGTFVLTTQTREKRHAEQRAYLELQVNLRAEQKSAKIIELLEELRRDMPTVANRVDPEANAMQLPVDADEAMTILDEMMDDGPGQKLTRSVAPTNDAAPPRSPPREED